MISKPFRNFAVLLMKNTGYYKIQYAFYSSNSLRLIIETSESYKSFISNSIKGLGSAQESDDFTDSAMQEYYVCAECKDAVKNSVRINYRIDSTAFSYFPI